jgi:hypothetical protein
MIVATAKEHHSLNSNHRMVFKEKKQWVLFCLFCCCWEKGWLAFR